MDDLKTYDVFFIRDGYLRHNDPASRSWSSTCISYENLCHRIESLSNTLTPNFTIDCYRWDCDPKAPRGSLKDGVVVLGSDHFKIFHEKNNTLQLMPCETCSHEINSETCAHDCHVWGWRY